MDEVGVRLNTLLKALNSNQLRISKATGINQVFLSDIILGKKDISREVLRKLSMKYPKVNLSWLLTGQGEMFMPDVHDNSTIASASNEYINNVPNGDATDDAILRKNLATNLLTLSKRREMKKNELIMVLVPGTKKPTVTNYFSGKSQLPLFALVRLEDLTGIGLSAWITSELDERELPFEPLKRERTADKLENVRHSLIALLNTINK